MSNPNRRNFVNFIVLTRARDTQNEQKERKKERNFFFVRVSKMRGENGRWEVFFFERKKASPSANQIFGNRSLSVNSCKNSSSSSRRDDV